MDHKTYNALACKACSQLDYLLDKHSGEVIASFNDKLDANDGDDLTFSISVKVKLIKEHPEHKSDVDITINNPIKDNAGPVAVNPDQPDMFTEDDDGEA